MIVKMNLLHFSPPILDNVKINIWISHIFQWHQQLKLQKLFLTKTIWPQEQKVKELFDLRNTF